MTECAAEPYRLRDYLPMLATIAKKRIGIASSYGVNVEFEDMMQEAVIAFERAKEGYDASRGVKFSTYLWRAVANHLQRVCEKAPVNHVSMDADLTEDGRSYHDILESKGLSTFERAERAQTAAQNVARLSSDARKVVTLLVNPPITLLKEFERLRAFADLCRENNLRAPKTRFDVHLIMEAMAWPKKRRDNVMKEINQIINDAV